MAQDSLIFKDGEIARNSITKKQEKEIEELYKKWADEIAQKSEYYKNKNNYSSSVISRELKKLEKELKNSGIQITKEIEKKIKSNLYTVSDSVVQCNLRWLINLGFNRQMISTAYMSVPDNIVRNLVTGQIYESGWSLSKKIWGDNNDTLSKIYKIIAGGRAKNESIYEICKKLEKYVNPSAKKQWNLKDKDGRYIYPKKVDYVSQRLARTLTQHSYQQSFVATTKNNPFIIDYIWNSNGSRVCKLCKDRDGNHYKKDELPLDHPNGMCTMVPNISDTLTDDLANWFNSPTGTYPDIDNFASEIGYNF